MKLASLINLKPLKEGAFGMSAKDLASTYSLKMLQQMRDETMMDMENDPSVEPEGGPQADYYGGTLNGLDQAIALKQPKKDVPYDVAVGKMTQDEYDEYMSTVKPDRDSFEKSSKFDRMNEAKIKSAEEFAATASDEQKAMAKKWDSLVTTIAFKKEDPKQHTANMEAKQEYLTNLNNAGKLKKKYSDDKIEDWSISSSLFGWKVASTVLPTPTNEGSCGYGPDGVPGDTPGETQGANADDRTRGMLRKLIQKEIAKLNESDPFQDLYDKQNPNDPKAIKGKHYPDEETVKKLKKGPYNK